MNVFRRALEFWLCAVFLVGAGQVAADPTAAVTETAAPTVDFARDVLPILSDNCFACHGPDGAAREADLRLDLREFATADRDGTKAIVPGRPGESELVRRIRTSDDGEQMPPADSLKSLTDREKDVLERWIANGADYTRHWAFVPPKRRVAPVSPGESWAKSPIDAFTLARMKQAGLAPAPPANRNTWLRRVTLDLTGLPPTVDELDAFLRDSSPMAQVRVVDRLLESDAHAERMAMQWLDAARYADTNGYNNDETRTMWPWRDWVIQSIRDGMPYDQFLTEQLAGDLLPGSTVRQKVATGFNRNHVLTTEGGVIPEEYQAEYVADRVHTAATVFLGISLQCARCHDHKFDPFTQRDFYRFGAYFNNIPDKLGRFGDVRMAEPVIRVMSRDQRHAVETLKSRKSELEGIIKERDATADARLAAWASKLDESEIAMLSAVGLTAHFSFDSIEGDKTLESVAGGKATIIGPVLRTDSTTETALRFAGETYVDAGQVGDFGSDDRFSLVGRFKASVPSAGAILSKMNDSNSFRGYDLLVINGKIECHVVHHWPDKAFKIVTKSAISLNEWHHICVTYDGSRVATGMQVYLDGKRQAVDVAVNNRLDGRLNTDQPFRIGQRQQSVPFDGFIDDVQVYAMRLTAMDVERLANGLPIQRLDQLLSIAAKDRTAAQQRRILDYFLRVVDQDSKSLRAELTSIPGQIDAINASVPVTMIMQELDKRRPTHVLVRGQYDQLGEAVEPGLPGALVGRSPPSETSRLDLARWMVDPSHPLTARVAVNRWWEMFFGTGLVETAEDFGRQGSRPSHPELLDWLATELVRVGWNQRVILKQIVLSATYGQSSRASAAALRDDPRNVLMTRGPRSRLPAEFVRDNALAVSGLLHRHVGGPSVRPYQPLGLWEDVSVERRVKYVVDRGPGLYRRSMYTFWKRTCPPPTMAAFDAPDRETCVIRRARTNTPLQALILLNDPTYVEASRAFAARILRSSDDDADRITFAFRCLLSRTATASEDAIVGQLLTEARRRFANNAAAADELLSVGQSPVPSDLPVSELAAWTSVASVLFNLDEAISKP